MGDSLLHPEWGCVGVKSTGKATYSQVYPRHPEARAHRFAREPKGCARHPSKQPQGGLLWMTAESSHRLPSTWVQIAIIPTNNANEVSAAASWITALNIVSLQRTEREHSSVFVLMSSLHHSQEYYSGGKMLCAYPQVIL
jgi:hypothetical protein